MRHSIIHSLTLGFDLGEVFLVLVTHNVVQQQWWSVLSSWYFKMILFCFKWSCLRLYHLACYTIAPWQWTLGVLPSLHLRVVYSKDSGICCIKRKMFSFCLDSVACWEANSSANIKAIHLVQEPLYLWVAYCSWPSVCYYLHCYYCLDMKCPPWAYGFKCLVPFGELWDLWDCGSLRTEGGIYSWFWYKLFAPWLAKMRTSNGCELLLPCSVLQLPCSPGHCGLHSRNRKGE